MKEELVDVYDQNRKTTGFWAFPMIVFEETVKPEGEGIGSGRAEIKVSVCV